MPWRSCAHPYVRRERVPLDLPCGPVIFLPMERLAYGPLRAVIKEGTMLFIHGTVEQRVELAAGLRTLVPRVLHELPLHLRPTLTFIRAPDRGAGTATAAGQEAGRGRSTGRPSDPQ
ncbi:hypothetical protein [Nonomuraea turcica]|uniref:hypothetical protein n=1 Tax=Nonomuraea sp. G32 TaxID=3067274 RepID=UPI00273B0765|nr:hypothetical protein [Nonomuraea sp. G32]MDP4512107.1 hypothetical protein [Nonomuraea sp. G32]